MSGGGPASRHYDPISLRKSLKFILDFSLEDVIIFNNILVPSFKVDLDLKQRETFIGRHIG